MATDFLFNVVLLLLFPIYLLVIAIFFRHLLMFVLLATFIFYQAAILLQVTVALIFSCKPLRDLQFLAYAPIYFIYSNFIRCARIAAYGLELVRSDRLKKGQLPSKVWKTMPEFRFVNPWRSH